MSHLLEKLEKAREEWFAKCAGFDMRLGCVLVEQKGEEFRAVGWTVLYLDYGHVPINRRPSTPASAWMPGTYAVGTDGMIWIAVGGNEYDGADRWEELKITAQFQATA